MGQRILTGNDSEVVCAAGATDEYITLNGGYTFNDVAAEHKISGGALLKMKSGAAYSGLIKVTLAGDNETVMEVHSDDLATTAVYVKKVWANATGIAITDIYLWK